ncbi:MAG TPA: hypothetical protein VGL83_11575 [Stellaceae bacterium]|jgi:hypothetical protein
MKRIICLAGAVVLSGCTSNPEWSRQGESSQRTAAELADCQSQARDATQRDTNIMNDIMASRGNDWRQSGVMSTQTSLFTAENQNRTGDIVNRCMIGKGFVPGS